MEWETGRHQPRERSRERESGSRASLRSKWKRFVIFLRHILTGSPHLHDPSLLELLNEYIEIALMGKHQFLTGVKYLSLKIRSMHVFGGRYSYINGRVVGGT